MNILVAILKQLPLFDQSAHPWRCQLKVAFLSVLFISSPLTSCVTSPESDSTSAAEFFGPSVKKNGQLLITQIDQDLAQLITVDQQGIVRNWSGPNASKPSKQSKLPFLAAAAWDVGDSLNRILLLAKDKSQRPVAYWLDKSTHRYRVAEVPKEIFQATGAIQINDSKNWWIVDRAGSVSRLSQQKPNLSDKDSSDSTRLKFQVKDYKPCQIPSNQLAASEDGLVLFICNGHKLEFYSLPQGVRINTSDQMIANVTAMIYMRNKSSTNALVLFDDQTYFNSDVTRSLRLLSAVNRDSIDAFDNETLVQIVSATGSDDPERVDVKVRRGVSNSDLLDSLSCKKTMNEENLVTIICEEDNSIVTQFDLRNGFGLLSINAELYQCLRSKDESTNILTQCVPI